MDPIIRMYSTLEQAQGAARALEQAGFAEVATVTASGPGLEAEVIRAAIDAGAVPGGFRRACTQGLQQGQAIVSVRAPFGSGLKATAILEDHDPVAVELPDIPRRDPAPLSDFLGIPTLARYTPSTDLSIITYTLGEPKLSRRSATPLSSLFGLKPLIDFKRNKRSSFGLPLLSKSASPLSSLFGMKTLTSPKRGRDTSFGMPMLSKNPAPLSSLLGLRVLSRKPRKRD